MFLSTGTEIAEHRLHCSEAGTLVVPALQSTDRCGVPRVLPLPPQPRTRAAWSMVSPSACLL